MIKTITNSNEQKKLPPKFGRRKKEEMVQSQNTLTLH